VKSSAWIEVAEVSLAEILGMRDDYRRDMNCQIVHDSWHRRGFTRSFLLRVDDDVVGYGAVGSVPPDPQDIVKEFFVVGNRRGDALQLFRELVRASGARWVETQTNDPLLLLMCFDAAVDLSSDVILFADALTTALEPPADGSVVQPLSVAEWGLTSAGELVASGGLLFHYNPPYGDIYMEVAAPHRRKGLGAYLVQELKRHCYEMRCIPAARCNQSNVASRLTLQRAGMFPCARIVRGRLAL
jgi:GNAT superfamily N-acetyltransferase